MTLRAHVLMIAEIWHKDFITGKIHLLFDKTECYWMCRNFLSADLIKSKTSRIIKERQKKLRKKSRQEGSVSKINTHTCTRCKIETPHVHVPVVKSKHNTCYSTRFKIKTLKVISLRFEIIKSITKGNIFVNLKMKQKI